MSRAKRNRSSRRNEWRKRQILLPETLVERLFEWHGGQGSAVYALASSGMRNVVSLSMIDAASAELKEEKAAKIRGANQRHLTAVINGLQEVRTFWKEHSDKEAGMDIDEADREYDTADYGMSEAEEGEIDTHSG